MGSELTAREGGFVYAVGREKIREFALATGETHPLYRDLDAARRAGYPDLVAPPMMVSVYAGPVFRDLLWSPELGVDRRMTVHGAQRFEWLALVIAGDEVTTVAELRGQELRGANRFIDIETRSVNQDAAVVTIGVWTVIVRTSPPVGRIH
jgi:acyl dehydratase